MTILLHCFKSDTCRHLINLLSFRWHSIMCFILKSQEEHLIVMIDFLYMGAFGDPYTQILSFSYVRIQNFNIYSGLNFSRLFCLITSLCKFMKNHEFEDLTSKVFLEIYSNVDVHIHTAMKFIRLSNAL